MLVNEVIAMSISQQARADVLDKLRFALSRLCHQDQIKVTKELISDLRTCLKQARNKPAEPVDHFAKLRVESKTTKLLTAEKKS